MQLDCFDNLLVMPPETILERMAEFDTDLLIGLEENCWPDPSQACHPPAAECRIMVQRVTQAAEYVGMVRGASQRGAVS